MSKAWPKSLAIGEVQQLPQYSLASSTAVPSSPLVYEGSVGRLHYDNLMSTLDFW